MHVHGGTRERRRELARTLQEYAVTVLLSSNAAEAAKCLADPRVRLVLILDDARFAETVRALRHHAQCMQPAPDESLADTTRTVLTLLRQCEPTSST